MEIMIIIERLEQSSDTTVVATGLNHQGQSWEAEVSVDLAEECTYFSKRGAEISDCDLMIALVGDERYPWRYSD